MNTMFANLKLPALISLLLVVPFMIMEVVNTQNINAVFNIPLFGLMWLMPTIFLVILIPMLQTVRSGNSLMTRPINLLARVVLLILIALMWTSLVMDQMPCFLGVPNCD